MCKKSFFLISFFLITFFLINISIKAQELFSLTEPASNMAAKSIGFRMNNTIMYDKLEKENSVHLLPEIMVGISRKWMAHIEGFTSYQQNHFAVEGGSLYLKYRFFSTDDIHSHFRMAAFTQFALNNSLLHQDAIDFKGHNSGYEFGMVATKLVQKTAVSSTVSFLQSINNVGVNKNGNKNSNNNAVNYTLSLGKLFIPKEYVNYNQTNINGMLELIGQTNVSTGQTFLDVAPVIQFIILSRMRLDIGYRYALSNDLYRSEPNGFLMRVEYNIFNAF